jgi:hypothetical protein
MATSNLPAPTLLPLAEEKPLLTVIDGGSSCCGGGSCSVD